MANFKQALPKVLAVEGGWSNHSADMGGATNKGITLATFNQFFEGGIEGLHNITDQQVEDIYRYQYWNRIKGDFIISQSVAELLFDFAVNSGVATASKKIQMLVGTEPDGVIGSKTIEAINSKTPKLLFHELWDVRSAFYHTLVQKKPSQKTFLKGWMNRLNTYKFEI